MSCTLGPWQSGNWQLHSITGGTFRIHAQICKISPVEGKSSASVDIRFLISECFRTVDEEGKPCSVEHPLHSWKPVDVQELFTQRGIVFD